MKKLFCALLCITLLFSCAGALADKGSAGCSAYEDGQHRFTRESVIENATCIHTGSTRLTCSCGYSTVREDPIDSSCHNFEQMGMSYPTCTEPGYIYIECVWCGDQDTIVNEPYGHSFCEWGIISDPTCTEDGERVRFCDECGLRETKPIPAAGHDYCSWGIISDPTCTEDGESVRFCDVCGLRQTKPIPATGHSFGDWQVLQTETCTAAGRMKAACRTCGETVHDEIPPSGHKKGAEFVLEEATDHSMGAYGSVCEFCGRTFRTGSFYPDGALYRGMGKNDAVKDMQQKLIHLDFLNDKADGIFGKNTEAAVRAFQKYAGLEQTGVAFPQTLRILNNAYATGTAENAPSSIMQESAPDASALAGAWEFIEIHEEGEIIPASECLLYTALTIRGEGDFANGGSYTADLTWQSEEESIESWPLEMTYCPEPLSAISENRSWHAVLEARKADPQHASEYALTLVDHDTLKMVVTTTYRQVLDGESIEMQGGAIVVFKRCEAADAALQGKAAYDVFPELESMVLGAPAQSILLGYDNYSLGEPGLESVAQITLDGEGVPYTLAIAGTAENTIYELWQYDDFITSGALAAGEVILIDIPGAEAEPFWTIYYTTDTEQWHHMELTADELSKDGWWYVSP